MLHPPCECSNVAKHRKMAARALDIDCGLCEEITYWESPFFKRIYIIYIFVCVFCLFHLATFLRIFFFSVWYKLCWWMRISQLWDVRYRQYQVLCVIWEGQIQKQRNKWHILSLMIPFSKIILPPLCIFIFIFFVAERESALKTSKKKKTWMKNSWDVCLKMFCGWSF